MRWWWRGGAWCYHVACGAPDKNVNAVNDAHAGFATDPNIVVHPTLPVVGRAIVELAFQTDHAAPSDCLYRVEKTLPIRDMRSHTVCDNDGS